MRGQVRRGGHDFGGDRNEIFGSLSHQNDRDDGGPGAPGDRSLHAARSGSLPGPRQWQCRSREGTAAA